MLRSKDEIEFSDRVYPASKTGTRQPGVIAGLFDAEAGSGAPPDFAKRGSNDGALSEFHKQIISSAREGIIVLDRNLRIRLWNPFMEEASGLGSAEVLGRHYSELFPFVNEQGLDALLDRALAGESLFSPDILYHVPASGKSGWASASYDPLRNHEREIVGVLVFVQEVTSRKLTEEALRQSEERYRNVVETATDAIYVLSPEGAIISLNQAFETLTGWQRAEWIGKSFLSLVHPDDLSRAAELFQRVFRGEASLVFELRFLSRNGEYKVGECTATPGIENGKVVAASGIVRDITARKRAEEALRQSEQRLHKVVANGQIILFALDRDGTYTLSEGKGLESLGRKPGEAVGRSMFEVYRDVPQVIENYKRALAGESFNSIIEIRGAVLDSWLSPLRDESGEITGVIGVATNITGRRRAEEALRESQQRLQLAVAGSNVGLWDWDTRTKTVYYSPEWKGQLGYEDDEVGDNFDEWESRLHPDDHDAACATVQAYLENPWPDYESEFRLRHKDGSYRWILVRASVHLGADGKPERMFGCHVDITERRQAEEALRQSEEKHRDLVENINDIVYAADDSGTITYISPVVEQLTGFKPSEVVGRSLLEFICPEDIPPFIESLNRTIRGELDPLEYRIVAKSGEVRWVRSSSRPLFEGDRTIGLRGTIADITAHKRVEARLERLATAVEQAAESIVITDTDGTIQYVNPAFERTTGYAQDEAVGQNPRILKSEKQDASFYRDMWNTISRGEVWAGRFINKRKDGTLFEEEATISPVRDGAGRIVNFVAVKRDVTKEVELEKQLLHAQKMEAVGRLAGGIAHDFNNLLTAIIGYSQLVVTRLGDDHALRSDVEQVLEAGHRAAALTSQLLAFSRRQTLIRRTIDLNETIANLMKMLRRIIGEDIDVRFPAPANLYPVFADAGQIEQVIMNLAVNARDAMPEGGGLIIETRNVVLDEAYCGDHLWARPGKYAQISVGDTGSGMDAETQRRIFEPFFTTKEIGKGTGLGLAVVYGIVQQHDGLIHVYSEPGHGTTFKIYLKAEDATEQDEARMVQSPLRGGSETILVAEDEETLRVLAKTVLESLGYRVLLASDGEEAVRMYEAAAEEIHLLILDLIMPQMGGREAFERMRAPGKTVPVIYMTGYAPDTFQNELLEESGAVLIQKPYGVDELGRRVREVLDR